MPTIVTGVDGSETAAKAARAAARLAAGLGADLTIITAYGKLEVERIRVGAEEYVLSNEASAETIANQTVLALQQEHPGLTISVRPQQGKPAEALLTVAEELGADVIVVGNRRVQGLARVLGSIASEVAQRAHCDVYIAHTVSRS
jgi:nucleotide-binding universal stress UspA family protein